MGITTMVVVIIILAVAVVACISLIIRLIRRLNKVQSHADYLTNELSTYESSNKVYKSQICTCYSGYKTLKKLMNRVLKNDSSKPFDTEKDVAIAVYMIADFQIGSLNDTTIQDFTPEDEDTED